MKAVVKIFTYFAAAVLLGAVLAPLLYWAMHAIEPWALANGLLKYNPPGIDRPPIEGPLAFLDSEFQKFFHRSVLIAAVALLWPAWRWMGGGALHNFGLEPDLRAKSHLGLGLLVGGGLVALMAGAYWFLKIYHFKEKLPWGGLPWLAVSCAAVAFLEEWVFRGAIMGLFLRGLRPLPALAGTTGVFAILHFLRSSEDYVVEHVTLLSGFELLPQMFHQFTEPMMLLAGFTTLFTLGWLLGYARLRTGSLWMGIGLHWGVIFVKMSFAKFTKRDSLPLPWVGPELQIGLVPVAVLLLGLYLVWRRMEYEDLLPAPRRSA